MKFSDRLYGEIEITDNLIQEVVNSEAFQRLKGVNQYGGVNFIFPEQYQVSRFEHSIGVWYVLSHLNVDLETQIAGLLHDVGHTAFSHMVDLAIGGDSEDFHETHLHLIPGWEDLQALLNSKNIQLKPLEAYPEIKTKLPRVGADRLDYAMRDFVGATNSKFEIGSQVLSDLVLHDRIIHFQSHDIAKEFAITGMDAMWEVIYKPQVAVVYEFLTQMLRTGLNEGWLTPELLYKEDKEVFDILHSNRQRFSKDYLRLFDQSFEVLESNDGQTDSLKVQKSKIRYFDPPLLIDGESVPLSEYDSNYRSSLDEKLALFEQRQSGEYFSINYLASAV